MIFPSNRVRILVATKPVDFRKGHDGLASLVQSELRKDPFTGAVFVFRAKRADRLKPSIIGVLPVHEVSERRACRVLGIDRSLIRYKSCRPQDEHIRERLRALSEERKRFGYRRLHVLLAREGIHVNHKKVRRLYREEGLTVRKRGGRKRALGTRAPIAVPSRVNERWSLDFVSDAFMDGRRFRMLCVVDDYPGSVWHWWPTHLCQATGLQGSLIC